MKHIFIVNPYAGKKNFADNIRNKLKEVEGLDYLIFNTRYGGYETELVQKITKMFPDESLRFYCCGGSGTMRNMLNGFNDLSEAEVAFYPCGLTNDFLKSFGEQEKRFHDIEQLINGDKIRVDYIETNHGRCLNTCSTGLDMRVVKYMNRFRFTQFIHSVLPYHLGIIGTVFTSRQEQYIIKADGVDLSGNYVEVFMGNGEVLGGANRFYGTSRQNDGRLGCAFYHTKGGLQTIRALLAVQAGSQEIREQKSIRTEAQVLTVMHKDHSPVVMNQDGENVIGTEPWEIRVVKQGLTLIVPKGVSL